MIKRALVVAVALLFAAGAANAQVRFGGQVSWGDDTDLGIGVRLEYVPRSIVGNTPIFSAAHFDYFFPDNGGVFGGVDVTYWEINYNVYYQFRAPSLTPYAGGGLHVSRWSVSVGGVSADNTDVGLNLGGGLKFKTRGKLTPFVEGRFTIGGDVEQLILTGGLVF